MIFWYDIFVLVVFLNGLFIFKIIYGMLVNLFDIFYIKVFLELDFFLLVNVLFFMFGVFFVLNFIGLLFWVKFVWVISIILLLIVLIYILYFYFWLKFSIGFCIFMLVFLLILCKDFFYSSVVVGIIFVFISFMILLFYLIYGVFYLSEGFNLWIESLMIVFYFLIEIMLIVGYGDIVFVFELVWLFIILVIIFGIIVFVIFMILIFGLFICGGFNKFVKGNNYIMYRKDHFIVCGYLIFVINMIL